MDLNPICQPSPANKMKCYFVDYVQLLMLARLVNGLKPHPPPLSSQTNEMLLFGLCSLLMISQAGRWTQTPSATPLQPIKWNTHFWMTFNFWWSAGLVGRLKPHSLPLCSVKKWNAHFLILFNFWWSAGLVNGLKPHLPALSSQKNEMLIFWSCSTSDDRLGWSMDSNPILHLSPAKEMKCSFFDPVQLLMIGWAGWWTQTPSSTSLQPKKWNAHFLILFNFWWSAGLVDGLKPHPPPLSSQNSEMLIFVLHSTCDVGQTGQWTWTSSTTPLQPKNEMLIFGLHSTFDDWPGWSMDLNPIHHPSPAKKMKSLFLYYVEVLVISRAGWWTRIPSATPLQPKKWNAHFGILFKFWWLAGLVDGLEPHPPPLCTQKKWNAHFGLCSTSDDQPGCSIDSNPSSTSLLPKNEILIFGLRSTSDDQLGWSMDSNPIHHPSPAKKMKCSFFDYVQLLMIGCAGQWTRTPATTALQPKNEMLIFGLHSLLMINWTSWWTWTPSATPLQPIKWNASFWIMFTSDDQPGWLMDSNPICHPSPDKKKKCSYFDYVQLLMIGQAGQWTRTPSTTPLQPKKMKCSFLDYIQLLMLATLVNGLKPHPPPLCSQKNEMLLLWITLNFWWLAGLSDGLKPHPPPLSSQK